MGREREGKEGYRIAYIKRCLHPRIDECFSKVEQQSVGSPTGVKKKIGFEHCVSDTQIVLFEGGGGIFPDVFIALLSTDPLRRVLEGEHKVRKSRDPSLRRIGFAATD